MGNYTVNNLRNEYDSRWDNLVITKPQTIANAGELVLKGKERYKGLEKSTGVPWYVIGIIHYRESDCNFNTHLHNGDSLGARTHHVPAGRPVRAPTNGVRYTFEESAIDALNFEGFTKIKLWSIEQISYCFEQYNGWGYRMHGVPSAYLYADTNQYKSGKYVADGVWDGSVVDSQVGTIAILKYIVQKESIKIPEGIVPKTASVPSTGSPKADPARPTNNDMSKTSRKFWWTTVMQWFTGTLGVGAGAVKTAQTLDLETTKTYAQTIKDTADIIGTWGLVAIIIAILAYILYMKYLMKNDVQEGRATPSGTTAPVLVPTPATLSSTPAPGFSTGGGNV
jgi:lysozyme family protein